jgi:hypothetical protein
LVAASHSRSANNSIVPKRRARKIREQELALVGELATDPPPIGIAGSSSCSELSMTMTSTRSSSAKNWTGVPSISILVPLQTRASTTIFLYADEGGKVVSC